MRRLCYVQGMSCCGAGQVKEARQGVRRALVFLKPSDLVLHPLLQLHMHLHTTADRSTLGHVLGLLTAPTLRQSFTPCHTL